MNRLIVYLSGKFKRSLIYIKALAKWILVSAAIGVLCGILGSAFHIGVDDATKLRESYPWLIWLLPFAGLAIVGVYSLMGVDGHSTNNVISEVQSGKGLKLSLIPSVFVSTILTHLCGGSVGREGAALQMGGTIGFEVGRFLHLDDRDRRTATLAGMAAFFSALFGTPLAATVFAMAVISVGLLYHAALIPCLLSSITAYGISRMLGIMPFHYSVTVPVLDIFMLLRVSLLACCCGFISSFFCSFLHKTEHIMEKLFPRAYIRVLVGGFVILGLSLLFPSGDYNGTGSRVIVRAVENGIVSPPAFLLKILFTSLSLAAGFKGGEVVPSFFIGATFGCLLGPVIGIPAGFAASVGLIAVFCGAVNCPIASIFLALELFGAEGIVYYAVACALSFVLSGYGGLYSSQRILYDKLKAQYIDVHTNSHLEGEHTQMEEKYR